MSGGSAVRDALQLPLDRIERWARDHCPALSPPVTADIVAAGRSNLTYRLTDASGRTYALRRPPAHVEVHGAHDVAREFRILQALRRGSAVRVPEPLAFCDDIDTIGAPFYLMEFVDGHIVRDEATAAALAVSARARAGKSLIDQLVALHQTSAAGVGLAKLGRPEGYLERQLRRWSSHVDDDDPSAGDLARIHRTLVRSMPRQQAPALVHGDFRLDNAVLADDGQVRVVLDWELSTLGDPLVDLGWLMLYWQPAPALAEVLPAGSGLPGFSSHDRLVARYSAGTGLDVADLYYYLGFAAWRLALITVGVRARYADGARAGDDVTTDQLTHHIDLLAAAAAELLAAR